MRQWWLGLVFIGLAVLFTLNKSALFTHFQTVRENQYLVEQTHTVLYEIKVLNRLLTEVESDSRGFLLTGDQTYLAWVDSLTQETRSQVEKLKKLAHDNPAQVARIEKMQPFIEARLAVQSRNVERAKTGAGNGQALKASLAEGRRLMGLVRSTLTEISNTERQILAERDQRTGESVRMVFILMMVGLSVTLALIGGIYFLIRRHILAQEKTMAAQEHVSWIQQRQSELLERLEGQPTVQQVADRTVQFLSDALAIPASSLFLFSDGQLVCAASHGGDRNRRYRLGEGLLGSTAQRKDLVLVKDVPEDYFKIGSSLGDSKPRHLAFVPLHFENSLVGILEMAAFKDLDARHGELLQLLQDRVATILNSALSREKLQELLEETQRQAEELQTQQEELRSSNEELEQQSSALQVSQEKLQSQQEELRQTNEELEAQAKVLETQSDDLAARNRDLEAASRYKSEFLAKMSHELRTPLNSMLILSSLLSDEKHKNLTSEQKEFASTIHRAGTDLLTLISDILDLSKLEARKLTVAPENFHLGEFCDSLDRQFRQMVESKGLKFEIQIDPNVPPSANTDRQRLEQILRNFLSNATKFTDQGGVTLAVKRGQLPKTIKFTISDTGIGIPRDKKAKIFEAFEQADGSTSRRYGGTGLGLTISSELARLLKGRIEVESLEGQGSHFSIEVPIELGPASQNSIVESIPRYHKPPEPPPERSIEVSIPQGNDRTVLIIEDDETFRKAAEQAAATFGFKGITVSDADEAFAVLHQHSPAAILLDLKLPGMSGFGVLETIKRNPLWRHIPIHIISGHDYPMYALRLGAVGFLPKPANLDSIRTAFGRIERVIDRRVKRILVIEDDSAQQKAMAQLLQGPDTEILTASRAIEGLELLSKESFDCVILDLSLPDMTGLELLEKIHQEHKVSVPPIIIYTGRDLSRQEEDKLRVFSESIIIKGAKSPERLLDEVNLFLHRLESDLPEDKRVILANLRGAEKSFAKCTVLLVDDDLRNIFAMTSALESKGLKVVAARNGVEALEALEKRREIDLVLMDIMMPKMDGFEATRRIRQIKEFKNLPIIALTAKAMKGDHEKCIAAGANDYLPKPINLMDLLSLLKVWIGARKDIEA